MLLQFKMYNSRVLCGSTVKLQSLSEVNVLHDIYV